MKNTITLLLVSTFSVSATTLAYYDMESTTSPFASTTSVISASDLTGVGAQTNVIGTTNFFNGTTGGHITDIASNGSSSSMSFTTGLGATGDSITYESFSATFWDPLSHGWAGTISWSDSSGVLGTEAITVDGLTNEIDFTDFTSTETITWTLTGVNPGASADRLRFDDLSVSGTINTVPEPSSAGLLGLGALIALGRRKR